MNIKIIGRAAILSAPIISLAVLAGCAGRPVADEAPAPQDRSAFLKSAVMSEDRAKDTSKVRAFINAFNREQPEALRTGGYEVAYDKDADAYVVSGAAHDVTVKFDKSGNIISARSGDAKVQSALNAALTGGIDGLFEVYAEAAERKAFTEAVTPDLGDEIKQGSYGDIDMSLPSYEKPDATFPERTFESPKLDPFDLPEAAEVKSYGTDTTDIPVIGNFGSSVRDEAKATAFADEAKGLADEIKSGGSGQ
jgi:hypothetical protein